MIKAARGRHFILWIVLALLLPAILLVGVLTRHEEPKNTAIPKVERNFKTNE